MKWLVSVIIIGLLGLFFFTDSLKLSETTPPEAIGRIVSVKGRVMGQSEKDEYYKDLSKNSNLSSPFKVITGFDSKATIEYGELFELQSNSSVRLLKVADQYKVHLISGRLSRKNPRDNTEFLIDNKAHTDLKLQAGAPTPAEEVAAHPHNSEDSTNTEVLDSKEIKPTKTHKKIAESFKLHQRFLEKCFIKHYERVKGDTTGGIINVEFDISKKGRISKIEIKQSDFTDQDFHICIKEVISRARILNYDTQETRTEFPIQIKLPL